MKGGFAFSAAGSALVGAGQAFFIKYVGEKIFQNFIRQMFDKLVNIYYHMINNSYVRRQAE